MDTQLHAHIRNFLDRYTHATLATCGAAGPQISLVAYQRHNLQLYLLLPGTSDHLFNLSTQTEVMLLTPMWRLCGYGNVQADGPVPPLPAFQTLVLVTPRALHILDAAGEQTIETIDL
jgi:hypothetical protein